MLFNSYVFILLFLPLLLFSYFYLNKVRAIKAAKVLLVIASLVFYSFWNYKYFFVIFISIIVNYFVGLLLVEKSFLKKKIIFIAGVVFNIALLGYFKYYDFFIWNIEKILSLGFKPLNLALPLGISFFTFQQIAFLVDSYRGETKEYDFIDYILFVSFFPQLIAGPIVHHKQVMPQFFSLRSAVFSKHNFAKGLYLFSLGIFKKTVIADTLAVFANKGIANCPHLDSFSAILTILSYGLQLYYDFSGYCDMAIGIALFFNIKLPINFDSPYRAKNLQDFWRRWHVTLGVFLRDYVYIPLGGSRQGLGMTCIVTLFTFLLCGFWHGAGYNFIFWGGLHGLGLCFLRFWSFLKIKVNSVLAVLITYVNLLWVFFRIGNFKHIKSFFIALFSFNRECVFYKYVAADDVVNFITFAVLFPLALYAVFFLKNSHQLLDDFEPKKSTALLTAILLILSVMTFNSVSPFLYFDF